MSVDRQVFAETSPAAPGTFVAPTRFVNLLGFSGLKITGSLTGATGGTLDIFLQMWDGERWFDIAHFPQLAAALALAHHVFTIRRRGRNGIVVIGRDGVPALAAGTAVDGDFGDVIRLVFVAGAGTTLGALQELRLLGVS